MDDQPFVVLQPKRPAKPATPQERARALKTTFLPGGRRVLLGAAVTVVGLVVLGLVSRPRAQVLEEFTQVAIEEGESRMVSVPYDEGVPPVELREADAAIVEHTVFLNQKDKRVVHVLLSGAGAGQTSWSVVFEDGRVRTFRTVVTARPAAPSRTDADRATARRRMEEGDRCERDAAHDISAHYRGMSCYREACEILRAIAFTTGEPVYAQACRRYEELAKAWRDLYEWTEGELTLARMNGDDKTVRRILRSLQTIAPDERSAEFQKNATLLRALPEEGS